MNNEFHNNVATLRASIETLPNSREKSLAVTKLDECEMWLQRVDLHPAGDKAVVKDELGKVIGKQG